MATGSRSLSPVTSAVSRVPRSSTDTLFQVFQENPDGSAVTCSPRLLPPTRTSVTSAPRARSSQATTRLPGSR
ncbi:hypothetical protein ACFVDT_29280 [Streptomyces sp. NPDC057699]|uniref:hypothetical protein n=1 Tax=Streptomyces sp. NPDC057699 TaxID=3346220 RepID=UPI0036A07809